MNEESQTTGSKVQFDAEGAGSEHVKEEPKKPRKYRRVRKKKPPGLLPTELKDIPGVRIITMSPVVQNVVDCVVGKQVTSENPWTYVSKESLVENLELHEESSEFLPIKNEILQYPNIELRVLYIPSETSEVDEFYVCTTTKAEEAVNEIIFNIEREREERLNESIFRAPGEWTSLGSEPEVEDLQVKNNRPLLEIEVESDYPVMEMKNKFKLRMVEDANDGYMNLLAPRQIFSNLQKKRIDESTQVTPSVSESESQTNCAFPKHMYTQYHFEYGKPRPSTKEFKNNITSFLENRWDRFSDELYVNSYINFYRNDYKDLARDFKEKHPIPFVVPHASFAQPHICKRKEIVCHSWHKIYTGIIAIAYSDKKAADYIPRNLSRDEVYDAMYDVTPVLLWSFKDNLQPRLLLETPREITALSFCPYDENVLIGGCCNGQIVIWDITNRLKRVEEAEILTEDQRGYRTQMQSLMKWMKYSNDPTIVRTTAVSELEFSHQSAISRIQWLPPFLEINKCGQALELAEDEANPGYQFITSSTDGSLMAWNLKSKPTATAGGYKPQKKLRRLKQRPEALLVSTSPYRGLNRMFKPSYRVHVYAPNTARPLPLTVLSFMSNHPLTYIEENPDVNRKFRIAERLEFRPILKKVPVPPINEFFAGTTEGDFFIGTWTGFDFNGGEIVNRETAKFTNFAKFHDGPVLSISRCPAFPDIILTVGGKVFAIWKSDFMEKPFLWRRNKIRYAYGAWNTLRLGLFRISRVDGCSELWNLKIRSNAYMNLTVLSGLHIGATTIQPFDVKQNILGLVDGKGTFRTLCVTKEYSKPIPEDTEAMFKICKREIERKYKFLKWQDEWAAKNPEVMNEVRKRLGVKKGERKKEEVSSLVEETAGQAEKKAEEQSPHEQWLESELKRMKGVILKNKNLDVEVLEKRQVPLLKLLADIEERKKKQEARLGIAGRLFHESVAMLYPETIEKKPPPPPDPYAGGDSMEMKMLYFENYIIAAETYEEYVNESEFKRPFNWLKILDAGKERRKVLDGLHGRYTHKLRIVNEKKRKEVEERDRILAATVVVQQKVSLGSIDYEIFDDNDDNEDVSETEA